MATVEVESRENWHDLHLLIDEYFTHYDGYIFRGQADANWHLESSLTRAIGRTHPKHPDPDTLALRHLSEFRQSLRGRCNLELDNVSLVDLWALGQHFGLFTPLLDWTTSPYVGLFFSLFGKSSSGRRVLWAVFESDISDSGNKIKTVRPLNHENPRIVSQAGLFLYSPVGSKIDLEIEDWPEQKWVTMFKIDFPDAIKWDVLAALNNMNINHASLFPDKTGSSLHTNFQLEIEAHLEKGRATGFVGNEL